MHVKCVTCVFCEFTAGDECVQGVYRACVYTARVHCVYAVHNVSPGGMHALEGGFYTHPCTLAYLK